MDMRVDWFSFTIPLPAAIGEAGEAVKNALLLASHVFTNSITRKVCDGLQFSLTKGTGFYSFRWFAEGMGTSFSAGQNNAHILWEFSGQGCENLRSAGLLYDIIKVAADRATRIDLACDMETTTTPSDFVAASQCQRFKSRASYTSASGQTEYIGSRSSERMARVYRYEAPHPRSHLLRAETEYKGEAAREICHHLCEASLISVTLSAHSPFGWQDPSWQPGMSEVAKLDFSRADKESARRVSWLLGTVIPAIEKADREGVLSVEKFREILDRHISQKRLK